jgi:hypothetical protein
MLILMLFYVLVQ